LKFLVQLRRTGNFKRFMPVLGPKFNRISLLFVARFPLDAFKVSGPGALAL